MTFKRTTLMLAKHATLAQSAIALAALACCALAGAQVLPAPSSADVPESKSLFEVGGQGSIAPRPFASFLERLSSIVDKIELKAGADNLPADGVGQVAIQLLLLDKNGKLVADDVEVTIETTGEVRVLLPGQSTSEAGPGRSDADKIQPGIQTKVTGGRLGFQLIAPFKAENVVVRVSVRGVSERIQLQYVPELRDMIAVGLLEGRLRSDKFDPRQLVPVREEDGFDRELKGLTKDFNGGRTQFGARAALYLKGKVKGDYLLTLSYDSDKDNATKLFSTIDPNSFYPVYGDSSIRGADAQSLYKLYVRLDKGLSHLFYGDFVTQDPNPARVLGQYSRSMPGLRGHYEAGKLVANAFVSQQSYRQTVDEFPGRGVSGPYSVSNPNGIANSEKIELIVRSRFQTAQVIKVTALTRSADYEFEPFSGQIVFRSPIPSVDDQLNPVSVRVTYEVEQGGETFGVFGGDLRLKVSDRLSVGVSAAKDRNPAAPYDLTGFNVALKLSLKTELVAELARSSSVVNTGATGFNSNASGNFAGKSGEFDGQAARVEIRHADDNVRARVAVSKASPEFNNPAGGLTGGKTEAAASVGWNASKEISVNAELQRSNDDVTGSNSTVGQFSADLKISDRLTIGAGARKARQNSAALQETTQTNCSPASTNVGQVTAVPGNVAGYNTGFGISQVGNQRIDPATGQLVVCNTAITLTPAAAAPTSLDRSQGFLRARFTPISSVSLDAELSRVTGDDASNLYRLGARWSATSALQFSAGLQREFSANGQAQYHLGADWAVAQKTRLYAKFEQSKQYAGVYGLGTGPLSSGFAFGVDSQYMAGGSVYSEYRIRDSAGGREVQSAIGLRNGFTMNVAEGVKLLTNIERLNSSSGHQTAAGLGLEYTADPLWKGSGRVEWRQDTANTNWLLTLNGSRKLDRNWTLVAREYLNLVDPRVGVATNQYQNRAQLGFAYRPADNGRFDALGLAENRLERNDSAGIDRHVDVISLRANYHPSRVWWVSGRYALKRVDELIEGQVRDNYTAQLFGARVSYDVTNRWTLGAQGSLLQGTGGGKQYGYGLEAGYVLVDNVWVTLGYNWRGFSDKDLTASEYTNQGWVLGVRYKFDEDLFKSADPRSNKTLTPYASPSQQTGKP